MPANTPRPPSSGQVAAFDRNAWPRSIGIPGRNRRNPHIRRQWSAAPTVSRCCALLAPAGKVREAMLYAFDLLELNGHVQDGSGGHRVGAVVEIAYPSFLSLG